MIHWLFLIINGRWKMASNTTLGYRQIHVTTSTTGGQRNYSQQVMQNTFSKFICKIGLQYCRDNDAPILLLVVFKNCGQSTTHSQP